MRGVGIDIAHIPRFAAALSRWGPARLCARILHPHEVSDFEAKGKTTQAQFLASRWAAKEAVIKATELALSPRHISIFKVASGSPRALLHDAAAHAWWSKRSGTRDAQRTADCQAPIVMLSLTHDGDYAAAVAFDE